MRRGKPRLGDLLFTTEAPLGQVALVDREDIALAQRVIKMRPKRHELDNQFLLYWMRSVPFQLELATWATGSTALGIKAEKLHKLHVIIPPLTEQRAIADYLDRETARLDGLVVLGRSIHTESSMVVYEPKMAKFLRKEARMTTAVAPLLSVSSRVQLTARQRACLEQIARRQTSPQRLVRRAKILLALETGATQCHVMRQMHL